RVAAEGPREIIRDGVDGALVPLGDTQSLSAAIAALLADPARRADLAAAGRARFEAEFAAPVVMATWRDYLAGVRR
ncbi:glycosyltransferase, partial [Acidiphilium sp. PM]|uniref:glycosyltransferase n=1 Tax=Acidiphilium sp. PM TaxID=1043206 RepID=UPI0002145104